MFLDLGDGQIVPLDDIVVIMDLDNTTTVKHTKNFFDKEERKGNIYYSHNILPRSFVVTKEGKVYLSSVSVTTLTKRGEQMSQREQ